MSLRRRHLILLICALPVLGACKNRERVLDEQNQSLQSLDATTKAVTEAWLSGAVSAAYARTALESTEQLLEKQRAALAAPPDMLADPSAARISQAQEQLARSLAVLLKAVDRADPAAARQQLARESHSPSELP